MSESVNGSVRQELRTSPITCRLRQTAVVGRRGPVPDMGEVELENVSPAPVEIPYRMTALQHLNLVVTDPDGGVISEGHFGDRFAPTAELSVLRLLPGETFVARVPLFGTVPRHPVPPGWYVVRAVYEFEGVRAESEPLRVQAGGRSEQDDRPSQRNDTFSATRSRDP